MCILGLLKLRVPCVTLVVNAHVFEECEAMTEYCHTAAFLGIFYNDIV
jgi:hypothetical protein